MERVYYNEKIKNTKDSINEFIEKYPSTEENFKLLSEEVNKFIEENNSYLAITDSSGNIELSYMINPIPDTMVIRGEDNNLYKVYLDSLLDSEDFQNLEFKLNDEIYVDGLMDENFKEFIDIYSIKYKDKEYVPGENTEYYISIEDTTDEDSLELDDYLKETSITGTIVNLNRTDYSKDLTFFYDDLLLAQINSFFTDSNFLDPSKNDFISYDYLDEMTNVQHMIFIKAFKAGDETKYIFVSTSLQPVSEALTVIEKYYIYFFIVALLLIGLLSFFYSKMISKPLIKINNVAKKMAILDFSTYCEVNSDDELGSLGNNLNILSKNLEHNLNELKIANAKLVDDMEKERQQENIRREFVANISHELKTPLGVIKSFSEGIKDGIYEKKRDYYLDVIIDEVEQMDKLILDMLQLSKLESKNFKLNKSSFSLDKLIYYSNDKFGAMIESKGIKVNLNLKESTVYADKSKIEQVVNNLFSNAIRYSPQNEEINISIDASDKDICFYMENTGTHIPEDEIHRIWDRFYRVEKSRSKVSGGTGLGLLIVKNILELHNSTFGVKNTNKGVKFFFSLKKG
ncbi:HAMP domain-containing sensor histidine kinase [Anaeromicrobium sediminis]|uniref:HAMP domain-containing sensor histidine kinase n=1 Tax=Anaeromicrobium sediminis TaxID=1478221 RepID=UPI00159588B0|nr:HAMP domain-containing sensor histidine kinase [Anaeromicrobium sediminis]